MTMDRKVENKNTEGNPTVPDVTGLGLMDALYLIENNGLKCSYSGTGHVTSQSPKGGERTARGTTVNIVLR